MQISDVHVKKTLSSLVEEQFAIYGETGCSNIVYGILSLSFSPRLCSKQKSFEAVRPNHPCQYHFKAE